MREIERKFMARAPAEEISRVLNEVVALGPPVRQIDAVYATALHDLLKPRPGTVVARVRRADGISVLTVKIRRDSDLDRDEYEVEVLDPDAASRVLTGLGLVYLVTVDKVRRTGALRSGVQLNVDTVRGLGTFVELEVVDQSARRLDAAQHELASYLGSTLELVDKGYDRLLLERGYAGTH